MTASLVKASKTMKGSTSVVSHHLDAVERARELYLSQIKRAEHEYFERIKRATEIITGSNGETPETTTENAPTTVLPPAS